MGYSRVFLDFIRSFFFGPSHNRFQTFARPEPLASYPLRNRCARQLAHLLLQGCAIRGGEWETSRTLADFRAVVRCGRSTS